MTFPTTVPAVLERAADLIEQRGLCQNGWYTDRKGGLCARGAIYAAVGVEPQVRTADLGWIHLPRDMQALFDRARKALAAAIESPDPSFPIISWNDAPERTAAEVVGGLRAAAEAAS